MYDSKSASANVTIVVSNLPVVEIVAGDDVGTTRSQVFNAAKELVAKGLRISDPSKQIQVYTRRMSVNGMSANYKAVVDSADGNRIITMFPMLGGG